MVRPSNLTVFFCLFALSGCASQNQLQKAEIRPLDHVAGRPNIDGLRKALTLSPDAPVRVFVTHGMVTNKPEYSKSLQRGIAEKLGLALGVSSPSIDIERGYKFDPFIGPQPFSGEIPLSPSEIRKTTWVDPHNRNTERLVFYEMLWAPLRDEVKNRFLTCFESRSVDPQIHCPAVSKAQKNTDTRAIVNGLLKDSVLVEGFSDAMIVLGPIGDVLRDDTTLAMCMVANDILGNHGSLAMHLPSTRCDLSNFVQDQNADGAAGRALQETKFFAITHSLGSFLFMDAQQRFAQTRAKKNNTDAKPNKDEINETLLFFLTDQSTVYMLANQIALLQLARLSPEGCSPYENNIPCPNRLLRNRPAIMDIEESLDQMRTYVAFNDVDDFIRFRITPLSYKDWFGVICKCIGSKSRI